MTQPKRLVEVKALEYGNESYAYRLSEETLRPLWAGYRRERDEQARHYLAGLEAGIRLAAERVRCDETHLPYACDACGDAQIVLALLEEEA